MFSSGSCHDGLLGQLSNHAYHPDLTQRLATLRGKTQETVLPQAISAVEGDQVEISADAAPQEGLRALISKLNEAQNGQEIGTLLTELQTFVAEETGASVAGGVLGELASLAGDLLTSIADNPDAFEGGFTFHFDASFQQRDIQNTNFYKGDTSFSYSFSLQTADTLFQGAGAFSESYKENGSGYHYQSNEQATVSVVTFNPSVEDNAALGAFTRIASGVMDPSLAEGAAADKQPTQIELFTRALLPPYQPMGMLESLRSQLEMLGKALADSANLSELLHSFGSDQEVEAAAAAA